MSYLLYLAGVWLTARSLVTNHNRFGAFVGCFRLKQPEALLLNILIGSTKQPFFSKTIKDAFRISQKVSTSTFWQKALNTLQ